jgi:hypothetical protein
MPDKPDKFDPYREALVVEATTIWPPELDNLNLEEKTRIENALHADPEKCAELAYIRHHTGFCRQITVTQEDVDRAKGG